VAKTLCTKTLNSLRNRASRVRPSVAIAMPPIVRLQTEIRAKTAGIWQILCEDILPK
jgi:hypothetical protein